MQGAPHHTTLAAPSVSLQKLKLNSKTRQETSKQTELMYKLNCTNCDVSYIGQTKRQLETRLKEHKNDIKKHDSSQFCC